MKKHLPILILILVLGLYLGVKALDEKSWDGWHCCSAQTLLSDKHWVNDGFIKSYFLFLPQGYSKIVRYFDDPELRHHAQGIATGGLIGKRLYYTHYPSGYLLPTAVLMKLGFQSRFWFRFLEILFSLSGFLLLYLIFNRISSDKTIAFLGVLFYSISTLFLNYADSLANQPLDELLRLGIIFLSIFALKKPTKNYFKYFIWAAYFALSISSYDSTFFVFAWLVGVDLIILRKIEWKKWLFWALAPILAFGLQILQNTWYLGWHDMLLDFFGAFKSVVVGSRKTFFISHFQRLTDPFDWFFGVKWYLGILISLLGIAAVKFIKKYLPDEMPILRFLYLGFAATLFHFLFFPSLFFYQAKIISVFGGFLIGSLTVLSAKAIFQKIRLKIKIAFIIIFIATTGLWLIQIKKTYAYIKNWPNNIWSAESISFDKKIKNLTSDDKVVFQMLGIDREVSSLDRYPNVPSEDEYYIGSPVLGFTNTNDLVRDFNYLKNRSKFPFSAIIIADQNKTIQKIQQKLKTKNPIIKTDNRFILII